MIKKVLILSRNEHRLLSFYDFPIEATSIKSFNKLRKGVTDKLYKFNHEAFQKCDGNRYEVLQEEKEFLRPLPDVPYEIAEWVYGRAVNLGFHVVFKKNRYFCPYQYAKKKVALKVTDRFVELYYKGERLTTHNRFPDYIKNKYSTHPEDMPPAFRNIVQWDDERIRNWASSIGKSTRQVIDRIFGSVIIKEQGYNPCLAVLRLSSAERIQMPVWKPPVSLPSAGGLKCPVTITLKQS